MASRLHAQWFVGYLLTSKISELAMSAKQILVPTDFSEFSVAALEQATLLAREHEASLLIMHVKPPPEHYTTAGLASVPVAFDDELLAEELKDFRPNDPEVGYAQRMVVGETVAEIVALAEQENVEMIVMGTHGRTGIGHLLIGSIAEGVVRKAPCPVLTIRKAQKVPADQACDTAQV